MLYDNIIISSTHRFMFLAVFVLKYKTQSADSRASEMVHNGSGFWNVVAMECCTICGILTRRPSH